jgi:hypothetical protein
MPKRLTAAELGDLGPLDPECIGRRVLIEIEIVHSGMTKTDIRIGGKSEVIDTHQLRRAAIEAEMKEPTLPKAQKPVAYLRDLDGTGSMHVCAKGDPGAIPVYGA